MKKPFVLFMIYIMTLSATAQEPAKMDRIMAVHDELMAKMPTTVQLIGKLQTKANGVSEKTAYEIAVENLKKANKAMQDWMVGYGGRFDADEMMKGKALTQEKQAWLEEEAKKISSLQRQIDNSISEAKGLLGS